jgi:hypothetical protein
LAATWIAVMFPPVRALVSGCGAFGTEGGTRY